MSVTSIDSNCGQVGMRSPHGWVRSMTFTWALPPRGGAATERDLHRRSAGATPAHCSVLPPVELSPARGPQPIGDDVGGQEPGAAGGRAAAPTAAGASLGRRTASVAVAGGKQSDPGGRLRDDLRVEARAEPDQRHEDDHLHREIQGETEQAAAAVDHEFSEGIDLIGQRVRGGEAP